MDISEDKKKALEVALGIIEKAHGKGAVMRFGEKVEAKKYDIVSSGSLGIDIALGVGGIPRGRIVEIYGPEAAGKTTVTLHVIAEVQRAGGIAAFIDAEHALDPVYAQKLGVNINDLYISQPNDGEQALEIAEAMIRSAAIDLVVIDSVAAIVPKAEISGEMGESHVGLQARLMSQALRKLTGICAQNNCIVIFTNQLREKIGVMFGSPETTTGGRALKFYASVRLDIRAGQSIIQDEVVLGKRTKVKVAKNKVAPPFKLAEFDIVFGEGISKVGEVLDLAVDLDIVKKSGSWFSYDELRLGQGREKVKDFLKENPDTLRDIESKVREHHGLKSVEEMEKAYEEYRSAQVIVPMEAKKKGKGKIKGKAPDKSKTDDDADDETFAEEPAESAAAED